VDIIDVTCDGAYPGGGWPLALTSYIAPSAQVIAVLVEPAEATGGFVLKYDRTNSKLMAYECAGAGAAMSEISGAELNAAVVRLVVLSR
jgi:hypothetical protein